MVKFYPESGSTNVFHRIQNFIESRALDGDEEGHTITFKKFIFVDYTSNKLLDQSTIEFFSKLGAGVNSLRFEKCNFPSKLELDLTLHCPNLKILEIITSHSIDHLFGHCSRVEHKLETLKLDLNYTGYIINWESIFQIFPFLQHIHVQNATFDENAPLNMLFEIQRVRAISQAKLNVKTLDIVKYPATSYCRTITGTELGLFGGLALKTLTIDIGKDTTSAMAASLFEIFRNSLIRLVCFRAPLNRADLNVPFGMMMPKLAYLTINDSFHHNLQFLNFTPNLRSLDLREFLAKSSTILPSNIIRQSLIIGLEIRLEFCTSLRIDYSLEVDEMGLMTQILPQVEWFTGSVDNENFRVVCKNWTKLNYIRLVNYQLTDTGLIGADNVGTPYIHPNITNLKRRWCSSESFKSLL